MNIFVTSDCPQLSAQYLDNRRVIKMILESAQMLSNAVIARQLISKYTFSSIVTKKPKLAYYSGMVRLPAQTHVKHPCSVWVMQSRSNYLWLLEHFNALCAEYTVRFGKVHAYQKLYKTYKEFSLYMSDRGLTPFANCARNLPLGVDFTHIKDTTKAYKMYLMRCWELDKREPKWS